MKKKFLFRILWGFPSGIALGQIITILISLVFGDGGYYPCVPALIRTAGSEIGAVILQTFLCGILGAGFAAASLIWEVERWSLVKQTGIYFLVISLVMMPIAYVTYWMDHTLWGIASYFGIFVLIFAVIWVVEYAIAWRNVKKLNRSLNQKEGGK